MQTQNTSDASSAYRSAAHPLAVRFANYDALKVRQRRRWIETLLALEMRNKYEVYDEDGAHALHVEEQGNGFVAFFKRMFLGPARPFEAHITDPTTQEIVLIVRRPFRFMFHRLEVMDAQGTAIGSIEREWSFLRRLFKIEDANGTVVANIFGPFLKPWTFQIMVDGQEVGAITKRWGGFTREMFTDADNFGVSLVGINSPLTRVLAFAATVLIDVVHFERAKG